MIEEWPICYLKPSNHGLPHLAPRSLSAPPSISGVEQVLASRSMVWTTALESIRLSTPGQILAYRAIALRRQGRLNPILIPFLEGTRRPLPPTYTGPLALIKWSDTATFSDGSKWFQYAITAKADAGVLGATKITITLETAGTLEPGMIFSIGEHLYEIQRVLEGAGSIFTVSILPPLRRAHPDNAEANFDRPVCRMRLVTDNEMSTTLELTKRARPTVNFIEDPSVEPVITAGSEPIPIGFFTPLDLGTKLRAWWHPDDYLIGADGVARWPDRAFGLTGTQADPTAQPVLIDHWVRADGSNDYLNGPVGPNLPVGNSNRAIITLIDQQSLPADTTARRYTSYGTAGGTATIELLRGVVTGVNRFQINADPAVDLTGVHICVLLLRNSFQTRRVDGLQSASTAASNTTGTTRYRHFCNISNTPAAFFLGAKGHEIIIADPTDAEIQKCEGFIAWDRGLTSLLPANHPYKTQRPMR